MILHALMGAIARVIQQLFMYMLLLLKGGRQEGV